MSKKFHQGRPRKYFVKPMSYSEAKSKFFYDKTFGRPRRKLVEINGEAGFICINCSKPKPLSHFPLNDPKARYFDSMCRACKNNLSKKRKDKITW